MIVSITLILSLTFALPAYAGTAAGDSGHTQENITREGR